MKGEGKIRIVVASTALSMGVNFPNVRFVINWGPPRNLLDFHQQAVRAGRDNLPSHVITIYHGHQLSHCEEAIKDLYCSQIFQTIIFLVSESKLFFTTTLPFG
mgnify:CR=1 FL=1